VGTSKFWSVRPPCDGCQTNLASEQSAHFERYSIEKKLASHVSKTILPRQNDCGITLATCSQTLGVAANQSNPPSIIIFFSVSHRRESAHSHRLLQSFHWTSRSFWPSIMMSALTMQDQDWKVAAIREISAIDGFASQGVNSLLQELSSKQGFPNRTIRSNAVSQVRKALIWLFLISSVHLSNGRKDERATINQVRIRGKLEVG